MQAKDPDIIVWIIDSFIAQPFVPQHATIGPGNQVVWFSGDVGHDHNIVVRDTNSNNNTIFKTGDFPEFAATRAITFNNTWTSDYADTIDYEGGFRVSVQIFECHHYHYALGKLLVFSIVRLLQL